MYLESSRFVIIEIIMDKPTEKAALVINALDYARTHNLEINNKQDVKKILEALDPLHTSEEEVKEFMKLLQDTDTLMEMIDKNKTEKTNLPN